jgi:hypothetical protein
MRVCGGGGARCLDSGRRGAGWGGGMGRLGEGITTLSLSHGGGGVGAVGEGWQREGGGGGACAWRGRMANAIRRARHAVDGAGGCWDGYGRMRAVEVAVRRCRREAATVEVEVVVARQKRCARKAAAMVVVVVGGGEVCRGDRSTTVSKKVCGRALDLHSRETADGGTTGEGVARALRGRRWFAWKGEAGWRRLAWGGGGGDEWMHAGVGCRNGGGQCRFSEAD